MLLTELFDLRTKNNFFSWAFDVIPYWASIFLFYFCERWPCGEVVLTAHHITWRIFRKNRAPDIIPAVQNQKQPEVNELPTRSGCGHLCSRIHPQMRLCPILLSSSAELTLCPVLLRTLVNYLQFLGGRGKP